MVVHPVHHTGLYPSGEIKIHHLAAMYPQFITAPQNPAYSGPIQVNQTYMIHACCRGCAADYYRILTPSIAALVDPQFYPVVININHIGKAIANNIAKEQSLRVVSCSMPGVIKAWGVLHAYAFAPPVVAQVGPVFYVAVVNQDDILQSVSCHIGKSYPRVGKIDVRKGFD